MLTNFCGFYFSKKSSYGELAGEYFIVHIYLKYNNVLHITAVKHLC
jgi:hypothetical protein